MARVLPGVEWTVPILGWVETAMADKSDSLEDHFHLLHGGDKTDVVARILIHCPGAHVCQSLIHKQTFLTNAPIEKSASVVTLFQVAIVKGQKMWMDFTTSSHMLVHETPSVDKLRYIVEGCSGIGAADVGYRFLGAESVLFIDQNPVFCKWMTDRYQTTVINGDVSTSATAIEIAKHAGSGVAISAGVLGDQGEGTDDRSRSFTGVLRLSHLLQAIVTILECTKEIHTSEWSQSKLSAFAKVTGCSIHQRVLSMHHMWPGHRDRWWCVVGSKDLPLEGFPEMPSLRFDPFIMHILPEFLDSNNPALEELILDDDELEAFEKYGKGFQAQCVNSCKGMPTATHSWGSQAKGCRCGCRRFRFATSRLLSRGIYGQLVPFKDAKQPQGEHYRARHMHPAEFAILCGLPPSYLAIRQNSDLRLDLAAVGQCASPLQSLWVFSNVIFQLHQHGMIQNAEHPRRALANFCRVLLNERNLFGSLSETMYTRIFQQEIESLDHPIEFPAEDVQVAQMYRSCETPDAAERTRCSHSASHQCTKNIRASDTAEFDPLARHDDKIASEASGSPSSCALVGKVLKAYHPVTSDSAPCTKEFRASEASDPSRVWGKTPEANSQVTSAPVEVVSLLHPCPEPHHAALASDPRVSTAQHTAKQAAGPLKKENAFSHNMPNDIQDHEPVDAEKPKQISSRNTQTDKPKKKPRSHATAPNQQPDQYQATNLKGKGGTFADSLTYAAAQTTESKAAESITREPGLAIQTFSINGGIAGFEANPTPAALQQVKRHSDTPDDRTCKRSKLDQPDHEPHAAIETLTPQPTNPKHPPASPPSFTVWVCHDGEEFFPSQPQKARQLDSSCAQKPKSKTAGIMAIILSDRLMV